MSDELGAFLVVITVLVVAGLGGYVIGGIQAQAETRNQAVKNGVAEFYIDTNTFQKEFRWKKLP